MEELISIVVPVFNQEQFIAKCLDSLINQTYKNIEIIVINDESTDNSLNILHEYAQKDKRIVIINQENKGAYYTRNTGIRKANGKYITFVDGDDFVSEEYCELLIKNMEETKSDVSCVKVALVANSEDGLKDVTPPKEEIFEEYVMFENEDIIKELLIKKKLDTYIFGKLFKTDLLKAYNISGNSAFESIKYIYDTYSKVNKVVLINKKAYFYFKHEGTITATCSKENIIDYLNVVINRFNSVKDTYKELSVYNYYALLEETTNICIKYIIANAYYEVIEEQLVDVFNKVVKFSNDNEQELSLLMTDFQKTIFYMIRYNYRLCFDFLAARHTLKWQRKFANNLKDKPKLLLVCDVPNWAFDKIAHEVKKQLHGIYNIRIEYFNRRKEADYFFEFIEENKDCDLMHFLNRRILLLIETDTFKEKVAQNGYDFDEYINIIKSKTTCGVCDFLDLDDKGIEELKNIYNKYTKMYYTTTYKLFDIYSQINDYKAPDAVVHDIIDKTLYPPIDIKRFELKNISNRPLVIGWVGNGTHSGSDSLDIKGFNTILKPVVAELISEGYDLIEYYADRNEKWRTSEEMTEYYSKIDICICSSTSEGTPLPILESMYSGIPIISTDVGIVQEAFGKEQKRFIIGSREEGKNDENIKQALKEKIIYLYNHREELKVLSDENMISIEEFDGGKTIKAFKSFFDRALKMKI